MRPEGGRKDGEGEFDNWWPRYVGPALSLLPFCVGAFPLYRDYASFGKSTDWVCLGLGYIQLGNSVSSATVPNMCS